MEQLAARWAHNPKVAGSSPAPATKKGRNYLAAFLFFIRYAKYSLFGDQGSIQDQVKYLGALNNLISLCEKTKG